MAELIERFGHPEEVRAARGRRPGDAYGALVRAIVGQQLSTKAARSIFERLVEHFGGHTPTPRELLAADPEEMRAAAGLSRAKVTFLRDLAEHVEDGELRLDQLAELPDEEVAEQLIAVKGLGPWTVHMFLIFHLGRPDVLPVGDLGITQGGPGPTGSTSSHAGRARADRGAVAPVPLAGEPLPLALARQRARLTTGSTFAARAPRAGGRGRPSGRD